MNTLERLLVTPEKELCLILARLLEWHVSEPSITDSATGVVCEKYGILRARFVPTENWNDIMPLVDAMYVTKSAVALSDMHHLPLIKGCVIAVILHINGVHDANL